MVGEFLIQNINVLNEKTPGKEVKMQLNKILSAKEQKPTLNFVGGEGNRASPCAFCMKVTANTDRCSLLLLDNRVALS
ncbi:hypothetical protein AB990_14340 [Alkalihalobacillus pseudalcaliphilus]|nr:hypothetical protein AB990_14340 [Alkalihalobacillus pseudalcaliphilus]